MNNMIYKRRVYYHDVDNTPQSSVLKITTRNGYVEYTQCNPDYQSDFNPKTDGQKQLYDLWNKWHIKKYCELNDEDKKEELIDLCNSICDLIEEEEKEYLESLNEKTEEDIDDDKILALGKHLGLTYTEMYDDITEANYGNYTYEYGREEYFVVTDDEADELWEEYLDNYIEEVILPEINKHYRNYFDNESWKKDARMDGRGHSLSSYDGYEYSEEINGETYYIYRIN